MSSRSRLLIFLLLFIGAVPLGSCLNANRFSELRFNQPSSYYLYVPDTYKTNLRWPLFIALHDVGEDSLNCISTWLEIAEDNQFFLLCPDLEAEADSLDRPENDRLLASILEHLYQDYELGERFFLAGRGEAARLALSYAFRYPQAIAGVAAIDPPGYPPDSDRQENLPILLILDSRDQMAVEAGEVFISSSSSTQTRLLQIDGLGGGVPFSLQRLSVDLFKQVTR